MPALPPSRGGNPIDRLMERASLALESASYFECERLCLSALRRAHAKRDYERMSRICLPLQEARRQKRQAAVDAAFLDGDAPGVVVIDSLKRLPQPLKAGCYLVQPMLVAADAGALRDDADAEEVPVFVLAREPLTREGLWPIAATGGPVVVRTKLAPPMRLERVESSRTKDDFTAAEARRIPRAWFEGAAEALGDAAIARLRPGDPAAHRVEDLLEFLAAAPEHEKLHQRLAVECRRAMHEPEPEFPRRRGVADDPFSF